MNSHLIHRWTPLTLKNGKVLRNRVVVPPMASQTADPSGLVTRETLEHYKRLSASGAGLLIAEYSFVHESGRSEEKQLGISTDENIAGLATLASVIRTSGALAGIQITHAGGKSESALTGGKLMAPGSVAVPVKDRVMETPSPMSDEEIELWKASFLRAADRAVQAGFDLVELHAAHGYGLNQWLSPITNQRQDQFGHNSSGRRRLLLDIVRGIRRKHPDLLISVRIPGQDFIEGGLSIDDAIEVARELEVAGVDLIHVSSGIGGWRRPSPRIGEGYLVSEAARIQAEVGVPVIGVGGIESGSYIDQGLQKGWFSLAAVGRAILRDPQGWSESHLRRDHPRNHAINRQVMVGA